MVQWVKNTTLTLAACGHTAASCLQLETAPQWHFRCGRDKEPCSCSGTGLDLRKLVKETCASAGCSRKKSTAHPRQRSSTGASDPTGNTELGRRMDESFSPVIFI